MPKQVKNPDFLRQLSVEQLHTALIEARTATQAFLEHWRILTHDPRAKLPLHVEWNLPEWEAGHIAWFQEYWIARNPDRSAGLQVNPDTPRLASLIANSDALYHSSEIAHDPRWSLPFPEPEELKYYLDQGLEGTLTLLREVSACDDSSQLKAALYFFRLALYHEDMHAEAASYSMNHYLHDVGQRWEAGEEEIEMITSFTYASVFSEMPFKPRLQEGGRSEQRMIQAGERQFGALPEMGFAFDNELPPFTQWLPSFSIDATPVSVAEYYAFIQAGGYQNQSYWSDAGWLWKSQQQAELPRFHRLNAGHLERCCFGNWHVVREDSPIVHITAYEAEAWCAWAERRLPSEHEWTTAAAEQDEFNWGQVWEWTQSDFLPFDGFIAHPYQDYSQPWFTGHRVLKGASFATHARMRNPMYRNFYLPMRNDIYSGFRTCAR